MGALFSNPVYVWLAFGAVLIAGEALTAPGLGVFLGGLGAICTGIIIHSGLVGQDDVALQFACFFGLTTIWALILWRPLMKFRTSGKDKSAQYSDVVGTVANVGEHGLKRGQVGQVLWSGTVMNAVLDSSVTADSLPPGAQVEIIAVSGNTFTVTPR